MTDRLGSQSRGIDLEFVAWFRARFCLTNPFLRLKVLSSKRHFVECVQWIIYFRCQKRFSMQDPRFKGAGFLLPRAEQIFKCIFDAYYCIKSFLFENTSKNSFL